MPVNGLTLLALIAFAVGLLVAWRAGLIAGRRESRSGSPVDPIRGSSAPLRDVVTATAAVPSPVVAPVPAAQESAPQSPLDHERARLIVSLEAENARLRADLVDSQADRPRLEELAEDRRALYAALADARAETARYRALVVEAETNAPSNLLDGPGSPDDLKLIVGVGPMLERMLQQLGVTTYRQVARWTERDIDEFDAKLPEFPGRIRRDLWVVQARALHRSKYGETP
jgi:predicted flap endonuclease-1-like 5' DNA nuclease